MSIKQSSANGSYLRVTDIHLSFGGVQALQGVSFEIAKPEIVAIIGPNGAGKTCILNCICGFYRPQQGSILYGETDLTKLPPHKIAQLGIGRTFQNITLYTGLNTLDNLMAARHIHMKQNFMQGAVFFKWAHDEEIRHLKIVENIIDFLEMEEIRSRVVGALPYGQRKKVDLGRALALEPKMLLLDEPMAGMNLDEREDVSRYILDIFEVNKIPIILIEHDMRVVMDISDRVIVIDFGNKVAEGSPQEVSVNPDVIKAYLGAADKT